MKVKDKVVIVTGASKGIGKEIAILLAKNGAKVVVNYSNSEKEANAVVNIIQKNNGEAFSFKADVSNKKEVISLFDKTITTFGKVDVLVNNAGIMSAKKTKRQYRSRFR